MAKQINALELRKHFGEILEEVRYRREPYVVTRNRRPMIVLLDIDTYEASKADLQEEAFIEEYSQERIQEFLKEDRIDPELQQKAKRLIGG